MLGPKYWDNLRLWFYRNNLNDGKMQDIARVILGPKCWIELRAWFYRNNLTTLAFLYGTDKAGGHSYTQHYERHFAYLRKRHFNLLEIGVGGGEYTGKGGNSLRMWKKYFPKANIFSIDCFDKSALQESRITIYQGSQNDTKFLNSIASKIGRVDVIIDDGSHINEHVLTSFSVLFPHLTDGGMYVIEDTHTAYDERFGGSEKSNATDTSMALVKSLLDALNWEEFVKTSPPEIGRDIVSVCCYHNLVFIRKGQNEEGGHNHRKHKIYSETEGVKKI